MMRGDAGVRRDTVVARPHRGRTRTTAERVNAETVVVLGWGRAILLQLAHPLVAAGVDQHSDFSGGLRPYVRRSRRTIGAMLDLTFGSPERVQATADRINAIHRRVHGRSVDATPRYPAGTRYSATDPDLLRWVHITLVESQLLTYDLLVGALPEDARDRYCAEAASVAPLLRIPDGHLPVSWRQLTGDLEAGLADGTVCVTDTARRVAWKLLYPGGMVGRATLALGRLVTAGLLPEPVRRAYGLRWGEADARWLRRLARASRTLHPWLPPALREWQVARRPPGILSNDRKTVQF